MSLAVLLSGGVDSSVALYRLAQEYSGKITAFYLKIWLEDELAHLGDCPWEDDLKYARAVCHQLQVPLEVIPLQSEYWQLVVEETVSSLRKGHTPSPDILCNRRIKFGAFMDMHGSAFDAIASGHYAQLLKSPEQVTLLKGADPDKDQTYFLSHLHQDQVSKLIFPIGSLPKSEVRQWAIKANLPNHSRPDSQGICFLGKIPFNEFVEFHLGTNPGPIREWQTGKKLGQHRGLWFHTIGQRKGLGLSGGPWFTVKKCLNENTLYVSLQKIRNQDDQIRFQVDHIHWITKPKRFENLEVKIRHGRKTIPCTISPETHGGFQIILREPDLGIAPGQYAVFYDGEICHGSGLIT